MKRNSVLLTAAVVSCLAVSPAISDDTPAKNIPVQIADNTPQPSTAKSRNVTAIQRTERPDPADETPAAKALLALGIALMITPDMFGGAFSN